MAENDDSSTYTFESLKIGRGDSKRIIALRSGDTLNAEGAVLVSDDGEVAVWEVNPTNSQS